MKETKLLEDVTGKTLTDDQKAQLLQAVAERAAALKTVNENWAAARAKIIGMPLEDLAAKEKEYNLAKKKAAMEAKAAAATTTTTTTTTTPPR
jgi:hypothetical protein